MANVLAVARQLWRYRYLIVISGLAGAVLAVLYSWSLPPVYQSSVTFFVRPTGDQPAQTVNLLPFRVLLQSPKLARSLTREFNGASHVLLVTENREANLLIAAIRTSDQALSEKIATRFAQAAVAHEREMQQQQAAYARDVVKAQLDEAGKRLNEAQQSALSFRKATQLDVLKEDAKLLLKNRNELDKVEQDLAFDAARLAAGRKALGEQQKILTLHRTVESGSALGEAAREATGRSVLGLGSKDEEVNSVYSEIAKEVAKVEAEVAGHQKRREALRRQGVQASQLPQLSRLYVAEAEVARLDAELDLTRRVYNDLAARYEATRVALSNKSGQLEVLEPPDGATPIEASLSRNAVLGGMAGLALGTFTLLLFIAAQRLLPLLRG